MTDLQTLVREELREFKPYSSARVEASRGQVWLNANESPWSHVDSSQALNRYPEQQSTQLSAAMSAYYGVDSSQLLVTRGSDEGIDLLLRLFCQPGRDTVIVCPPTFGMYQIAAQIQSARVITVPLSPETFALNPDAILAAWNPSVKLIVLCSPNNPTGNSVERAELLNVCAQLSGKALVVVDEAYVEYSQAPSFASEIQQVNNLVILRTLSKAFGLAAARVGVVIANEDIINWLKKILAPYPLPSTSTALAIAAFQPDALRQMSEQITTIQQERSRIMAQLSAMDIVETVWPSDANYLFVIFKRSIMSECAASGIILRDMHDRTGIHHAVRISIGAPEENQAVIDFLTQCQVG